MQCLAHQLGKPLTGISSGRPLEKERADECDAVPLRKSYKSMQLYDLSMNKLCFSMFS